MCRKPSCCVTRDKRLLWHYDIDSHSELAEVNGVDDDDCAKYEYDLIDKELIVDHEPDWVKQSHRRAAERHFTKHFGTDSAFQEYFNNMDLAKINWWDLCNITDPGYPSLCRRRYPSQRLRRRLCRRQCLTYPELLSWQKEWLQKWIDQVIRLRNRNV